MSDSLSSSWSDSPNAPQISYPLYLSEKANFAGFLIGTIFYGTVVVLFFRCMGALLDPVNRASGTKWALVIHTVAMFLFATVYTATNLDIQSISYVDHREFSGIDGVLPSGPLSYQLLILPSAVSVGSDVMFLLNSWLADGLLLYRCFIIYAKNYWIVAFPCLMYLGSLSTGIALLYYQATEPETSVWSSVAIAFNFPYYAIALSLNVLLTTMIVIRLILHRRKLIDAMGARAGTGGVFKAIITMLVESCALYAASSLLFLGPWGGGSAASNIFFPILGETQVIALFLITLRVANKSALTSKSIVSGNISSLHFDAQGESTTGDETVTDMPPADPGDAE